MRKSIAISAISLIALLLLASPAFAGGYLSFGGGGGGKAEAGNFSFDLGGFPANYLFGIGFTYIFSGDVPSDILEYPVPHSDYTSLGKRQNDEYGFFMKGGLEVIKNRQIFLFGLAGLTFVEEIELAQSNVTGWYYEQSSSTKSNGIAGGGIGYFPKDKWFCLQLEYDNRRGLTGSTGFVF